MKKQIITATSVILLCFVLLSASVRRSSSGAPASHTGAPGEATCGEVGCHDDNQQNAGTAKILLQLGDQEMDFIPGKTYPIKVRISDAHKTRFGFQLVALDNKTQQDRGNFTIVDSARTQMVNNRYKLTDRNYVTYTFEGTDASGDDYAEWIVNWTAPENTKKGVTFYLGAVSANDDMSDKGDMVYNEKFTFNPLKK